MAGIVAIFAGVLILDGAARLVARRRMRGEPVRGIADFVAGNVADFIAGIVAGERPAVTIAPEGFAALSCRTDLHGLGSSEGAAVVTFADFVADFAGEVAGGWWRQMSRLAALPMFRNGE